ncbi:MAG: amidohydrolase family protein [Bacteroidia bacterium]
MWAQAPMLGYYRGLYQGRPSQIALVGGNIWLAPGQYLQDGVILIKDGRILQVGERSAMKVPREAFVVSYPTGVWIYPAFVDPWSSWGLKERSESATSSNTPQYDPTRHPLYYPVDAVKLDFAADTAFVYDAETAKKLREMGYAVAHVAPREGVLRGTGTTLLLSEEIPIERRFLRSSSILHAGFEKGSSTQMYPVSKMGCIALVRQILYDWLWYRQFTPPPVQNVAMERLRELWRDTLRWVWVAQTPEDAFRVAKLSNEWRQGGPLRWALLGTGFEHEWLPFLPKEGLYILPIGLPTLPPLHTAESYMHLPLAALRRWEQAPFRLKWMIQEGYTVALTAHKTPDPATFWNDLRTLARTGIAPDTILLCLTRFPAAWLKLSDVGTISPGAYANLLIFTDTIWKEEAKLAEVWVAGQRSILNPILSQSPKGIYELSPFSWRWSFLRGKTSPLSSKLIIGERDTQAVEVQYDLLYNTFKARIQHKAAAGEWTFAMEGDSLLTGTWLSPTGEKRSWQARLIAPPESFPPPKRPAPLSEDSLIARRTLPPGFYGHTQYPGPVSLLIRRATVWTGDTILPETDVLIGSGKILRIGRALPAPPGAEVVEANGAALTAGIIDEHSHIAIEGGVNEYSDAITSEVRIADVIDPTDVNIYRHLAGGVTTVQLLHGSANPIGGQSACIKLRWGLPPDSLVFAEAPPFNKFALGENVKQSNWGEAFTIRYPQTRMGVEQIMTDAFAAARRYANEWEAFKAEQKKSPRLPAPRRNLRLEPLAEILSGKRYITCHSYVQSEILMLMRLAERFGFRVRTFTHVLEGYKVAPELKAHGAFASTFSDWWAYKYEVIEAIPHNAAILLKHRVPTCINSDDAEMGRRLNQEAAKVLRYGGTELGIDSVEAWRTVTVYPAQALGISHRVGYIREGYDADVVLWDRPSPLSVQAKVQLTLVDGRKLYDAKVDKELYPQRMSEKKRLVEKAWQTADPNRKGIPLLIRRAVLWDCESIGEGEAEGNSP